MVTLERKVMTKQVMATLEEVARANSSKTARSGPTRALQKPEREKVRLSLDISPELNDLLEGLAATTGTTKSDVLRRAITLMEVAVDAKRQGKRIGIATKDQILATEIIGF